MPYWTSREATSTRELPSSLVILGGGVVGVEMAQVFVRFGVRVTLVEGGERILSRDHPLTSKAVADQLEEEGLVLRTGATAQRVRAGAAGRIVELSDGTTVEGAELLVAVGRRPADLRALGAEEAGATLDERGAPAPDDRLVSPTGCSSRAMSREGSSSRTSPTTKGASPRERRRGGTSAPTSASCRR